MTSFPLFERWVFDEGECMEIERRMRSLCGLKIAHDSVLSTLALPAYLSSSDPALYRRTAAATNARLWEAFQAQYELIATVLEEWLQAPLRYAFDLALPGFHLFTIAAHSRYPGGGAHFDAPHRQVTWNAASDLDPDVCFSFTIPIKLPPRGAAVEAWPYWLPLAQPADAVAELGEPPLRCSYDLGRLVVTNGQQLHRIAPIEVCDQSQERITLQGHIVRYQGVYVAFW